MAFIMKIDGPVITRVVKELKKNCSVLTFDFSEHGLGLNVSDDNNAAAYSIMLASSNFAEYEFTGDDVERVSLNTDKFSKILEKMSYPFQMESTMDGSIRLVSEVGRQAYKQNPIDAYEKYHNKSDVIKEELEKLMNDDSAVVIRIMHQDIKEALRNVGIDSKNVIINLDKDRLNFIADSIEVEAETHAPLIKKAKGEWKMAYNIAFFKDLLDIIGENRELVMRLFPDRRSFVLECTMDDGTLYRLSLAPVLQRKAVVVEEEVVESGDVDESESEMD